MNTHYTYLILDLTTLLFPFLLSFDKKVAFYKTWPYLWRGILLTGSFFIVWDILFTRNNVWSFNNKYILGWRIAGLPIEEWLFFIVVPYACTFIYCCLRAYLPARNYKNRGWTVLLPFGILLVVTALIFTSFEYTFYSFFFCGIAIIILYIFKNHFPAFRADLFLYTFLISTLPFLLVNGILTALPIIIYNDNENLGLRIYTIPFEDNFYGMLLMLGSIISLPQKK